MANQHVQDSIEDRLLSKIEMANGCWIFTGGIGENGYGRIWAGRRYRLAHRLSYETWVGPIPNGAHLDHLCRTRACIRPAHLEIVTPLENQLREKRLRTQCPKGHPYDATNTVVNARGQRSCRTCRLATSIAWNQAHRDVINARERNRRRQQKSG